MLKNIMQIKYFNLLILITVSNFVFGQKKILDSASVLKVITLSIDDLGCQSKTIFPKKGRTYNEFVGNYAIKYGFVLADGWRKDSCNGGFNKEIYNYNPYISTANPYKFEKLDYGNNFVYFFYKKGKRFSGRIIERFVPLGSEKEIVFKATCKNGKLQGKGTLAISETNELLAQCNFENGELVGVCSSSDLDLKVELKVTYVKGSQYPINVTEVQIVPLK